MKREYAADQLFATLDTTARRCWISDEETVVASDTVGFIRKLPHQLVEAFKATLEELEYADLLLHVIDVSNPEWQHQAEVVEKLIVELKDKLKIEDVLDHQVEAANGAAEDTVNAQGLQADAVQALTALGYGSTEALQAVRKVEMDESTTVEDLLKGALKYLI